MANTFFQFKEFRIDQSHCAMKVSTDACLFGGWVVEQMSGATNESMELLDIGTGTGLLTLMVAQKMESVRITAVEIDMSSADQALENIKATPWKNKIEVLNKDIRAIGTTRKFDRILCNPPFYEGDLGSPDPKKNLAHHDASLRFEDLTDQIDRLLTQNGVCYLLLPAKKKEIRIRMLAKRGFCVRKQVHLHHSEDHPTLRIFLEIDRSKQEETLTERIDLMQPGGTYAARAEELLRDYYLAF